MEKVKKTAKVSQIPGGVTAARGFEAAGIASGIRENKKDKLDLALVYSQVPAVTAGTFTTNLVKAAPVKRDQALIRDQMTAQAVVLNSGIANACTGEEGIKANAGMAAIVAKELGIETNQVLTCSTGVIGMPLSLIPIEKGVPALVKEKTSDLKGGTLAAKAIMTTDTRCKECAVTFQAGGKTVTLGGMSKGSGMIHPNMATMLSVMTTDLCISKSLLQEALSSVVQDTFNMISIDRDTSTNDTLLVLANGMAGNEEIKEKDEAYAAFYQALLFVAEDLAKKMAGDGEGATKLLEVTCVHAPDKSTAKTLSKAVITSNLVKTAVFGSDANWGRILCAMGYSGASFDPDVVDITISSKAGTAKLVENGMATAYDEAFATKILNEEKVTVVVDVKNGDASATAWGCDLTFDYVHINGDYRS